MIYEQRYDAGGKQHGTRKEKKVVICTHKVNAWYIVVTKLTVAIIVLKLYASK